MKRRAAMLAGLAAALVAQAEPALTSKSTELQAQPQSDAQTTATLPGNTKVEVLSRKGAWTQVRTGNGQAGWVRMMSLKPEGTAQAAPAQPGNAVSALGNLLSAGRTSNTATVTTGVRGLGEAELQNAHANPAELEKMQKLGVDKNTAQAFAQRSKLVPSRVDYLPEPGNLNNARNAEGN